MKQTVKPVILSGMNASRSGAFMESKDPVFLWASNRLRKEFSAQIAFVALAFLLLTTGASAQTLTGTVKNATTGKPAAGDEVVLLNLGQGMEEAGRSKADSKGNFSF
jgi:hypothetical protein